VSGEEDCAYAASPNTQLNVIVVISAERMGFGELDLDVPSGERG